jgi:hypothetical protein
VQKSPVVGTQRPRQTDCLSRRGCQEKGLRVIDIADRKIQVLTTEADNLPDWSPDGSRIVFTRSVDTVNSTGCNSIRR